MAGMASQGERQEHCKSDLRPGRACLSPPHVVPEPSPHIASSRRSLPPSSACQLSHPVQVTFPPLMRGDDRCRGTRWSDLCDLLESLHCGSLNWYRAALETFPPCSGATWPVAARAGDSPHSCVPVTRPPDLLGEELGALTPWLENPPGGVGGVGLAAAISSSSPLSPGSGSLWEAGAGGSEGSLLPAASRPTLRTLEKHREQVSCSLEAQRSPLVLLDLRSWQGVVESWSSGSSGGGQEEGGSRGSASLLCGVGLRRAWVQLLAGLVSGGRGDGHWCVGLKRGKPRPERVLVLSRT